MPPLDCGGDRRRDDGGRPRGACRGAPRTRGEARGVRRHRHGACGARARHRGRAPRIWRDVEERLGRARAPPGASRRGPRGRAGVGVVRRGRGLDVPCRGCAHHRPVAAQGRDVARWDAGSPTRASSCSMSRWRSGPDARASRSTSPSSSTRRFSTSRARTAAAACRSARTTSCPAWPECPERGSRAVCHSAHISTCSTAPISPGSPTRAGARASPWWCWTRGPPRNPSADPLGAKDQAQLAAVVVELAEQIDGQVIVVDHSRKNRPDGQPLSSADIFGPPQKWAAATVRRSCSRARRWPPARGLP